MRLLCSSVHCFIWYVVIRLSHCIFGLPDIGITPDILMSVEDGRRNIDRLDGLLEAVRNGNVNLLCLLFLHLLQGAQFYVSRKLWFWVAVWLFFRFLYFLLVYLFWLLCFLLADVFGSDHEDINLSGGMIVHIEVNCVCSHVIRLLEFVDDGVSARWVCIQQLLGHYILLALLSLVILYSMLRHLIWFGVLRHKLTVIFWLLIG